ncbi:hypothetical protein H5410_045949 [Solanum commersonii]|uniref:DUF4283 domain-containing protein n=1 Tax=Solanum commersonii TaxID=4109 RepID=A0A9J5XAY4_SOLCO|nr:hypothetical protein H5410_045949 [Solanum commersonii]
MSWICQKLKEASKNRGKTFKSWKCKDNTTNIFLTQKFNQYEKFVSVITVKGNDRAVIILPENTFNEGRNVLVAKIENFINRKRTTLITNKQPKLLNQTRGEKSYKEMLFKNKWTKRDTEEKGLLDRCLVGSFTGAEDTPTRNDIRRWEIRDGCGGWLETEEERGLKNHLRWARIRVKGPREKILATIDVRDGDLISLPIWLELPSTD